MARECALGTGGPWFCPEVRPRAGVSRNPQPAVRPWRPLSARGSTLFLLLPGVSQLQPHNFQRSRPSWSLGNTLTNGPLDLLRRHWDTHDSGIPGPSSPRNIGSSRSSPQRKTQNEDPRLFPLQQTPGRTLAPFHSRTQQLGLSVSYILVKQKSVPGPCFLPCRGPRSYGPSPLHRFWAQIQERSSLPSK